MKNCPTMEESEKDKERTLPASALDDSSCDGRGQGHPSSVLIAENLFNHNRFQNTQGFGAQYVGFLGIARGCSKVFKKWFCTVCPFMMGTHVVFTLFKNS